MAGKIPDRSAGTYVDYAGTFQPLAEGTIISYHF
jgi:hypothetical protein